MNTARTTTLSFGAALIASVLVLLIDLYRLQAYQRNLVSFLAIAGILFLAHGTGFLQEKVISPILRTWRKRFPVIAIISDLPWSSEKRTFAWAWSEMTAEQWKVKLVEEARRQKIKTKVSLIKVNKTRVRFFIERYNVIINPYGSVYPETNIKGLSVWNTISSYVLNGGVMVNLADIPFYYAYDESKEISYELIKPTDHFIPTEYEQVGNVLKLRSGTLRPISTFSNTPFLSETHVQVFNTEQGNAPMTCVLELKEKEHAINVDKIEDVAVNRAFLVREANGDTGSSNIRSIVEEIRIGSQSLTPLCYIYFGNGHFLISLLFLEYAAQPHNVKTMVTKLMASLILKEIRRPDMEDQRSINIVAGKKYKAVQMS